MPAVSVPDAAKAAVKKWLDANIFGRRMTSDERAQLIADMKQVSRRGGASAAASLLPCVPSLALDGAHCAHSPPLTPNPRRFKERLRLTHLSTRRMTKR